MKYLLFLLGSSLAVTGTAHAQLGLRLGGSLAQFHTSPGQVITSSSSVLAGYQVGFSYQVPLTAWLSLVPEVQYSYERLKLTQVSFALPNGDYAADLKVNMRYLNVPVLVRATFGRGYVEAGPQASYLLGGRQTGSQLYTSAGTSQTYAYDQATTSTTHRFDVGPWLGLGVKLPAGLGVDGRAYQGLTVLNNDRSQDDGGYKRQSLQVSLTYQLTH